MVEIVERIRIPIVVKEKAKQKEMMATRSLTHASYLIIVVMTGLNASST